MPEQVIDVLNSDPAALAVLPTTEVVAGLIAALKTLEVRCEELERRMGDAEKQIDWRPK